MAHRIRLAVPAAAVAAILLVGCSSEESWDEVRQRLIDGGMTPDQVDCLEDGLNERGLSLTDYDSPDAADQGAIVEVTIGCAMGDNPLPTVP
jgi:hypothetical protein